MEMSVNFGGGRVVEARFRDHTVKTDQSLKEGGENSAPTPFDLMMVSLATCSAYYVLKFCLERKIPTEGISLEMDKEADEKTRMLKKITIEIKLPPDFPEKYDRAVVKAAESCSVKKLLLNPPEFETRVSR